MLSFDSFAFGLGLQQASYPTVVLPLVCFFEGATVGVVFDFFSFAKWATLGVVWDFWF